jgi:hypothetical protein
MQNLSLADGLSPMVITASSSFGLTPQENMRSREDMIRI